MADGHRNVCRKCTAKQMRDYQIFKQEHLKEYFKTYYQKNREKIIGQVIERKHKFPERNKEIRRKMKNNKYATNIQFNMKERLRSRLTMALNSYAIKPRKVSKTMELLDCSIEEFKAHIESKFQPGMSWENRKEWHIDHVRPCAAFDLTDEEQQQQCFHYSNLQPLWAEENRIKGAKLMSLDVTTLSG